MGQYQGTFQLSMLPPPPAERWSRFGLGAAFQTCVVALVAAVPIFHPQVISPRHDYQSVTLVAPELIEHPAPPKARVKLPPPPVKPPVQVAKLEVPPMPRPLPKNDPPPAAMPKVATKLDLPSPPAARLVRTGLLEGSSAKPTLNLPARKVQTGGFGDPNGVPPQKDAHGAVQIASLGQFDLPAGKGNGNGTGGTHGVPGTVKSAGFGNGVATGTGGPGGRGGVAVGGFGNGGLGGNGTGGGTRAAQAPTLLPLEILDKPNPIYTDEARRLKVEGEVLLEVDFGASGDLRVLRVVRGLGHGLDEAAVRAAQHIRFKPAQKDGRPEDTVATLHVVFQLAY
ncbi:MAG TPA: energy transducer TonB [Terriglobales bacterium]|jgi:TonB family protein|nr:energy transducer TonB [Terriglobales bacterium]